MNQPKKYPLYLGGCAASIATIFTHPLDLLKVQLQANSNKSKNSILKTVAEIKTNLGYRGFYTGLSAGLLRQATYSSTRFATYDILKAKFTLEDGTIPFVNMVLAASIAGAIGGIVGNPADLINVRMQNDIKLPIENRRNYRNAFDGIFKVIKHEGYSKLMKGVEANTIRAILMTSSQLACYDFFKTQFLRTGWFKDNLLTHFSSSLLAGGVATTLCSPVDVLKTRVMSNPSTKNLNLVSLTSDIFIKEGYKAFFKGWVPSFTRLGPQTVLTLVVLEQLRKLYDKFART